MNGENRKARLRLGCLHSRTTQLLVCSSFVDLSVRSSPVHQVQETVIIWLSHNEHRLTNNFESLYYVVVRAHGILPVTCDWWFSYKPYFNSMPRGRVIRALHRDTSESLPNTQYTRVIECHYYCQTYSVCSTSFCSHSRDWYDINSFLVAASLP